MAVKTSQHGLNSHLLITGSVTTYEGVSVTGATVQFCPYGTKDTGNSRCLDTQTTSRGHFSFTALNRPNSLHVLAINQSSTQILCHALSISKGGPVVRHLAIKLDPAARDIDDSKPTMPPRYTLPSSRADCVCSSWTDHGDFNVEGNEGTCSFEEDANGVAQEESGRNTSSYSNDLAAFIFNPRTTPWGIMHYVSHLSQVQIESLGVVGGVCAITLYVVTRLWHRRQYLQRSKLKLSQENSDALLSNSIPRRRVDERRVYCDGSVRDTWGLEFDNEVAHSACAPASPQTGEGDATSESTRASIAKEDPQHSAIFNALSVDPLLRAVVFTPH
mmetsp:Transcript_74839/g.150513  ORF Transcript_74839/g.150513 Transcript_74839/m.150513 type:complete len:331 (-) Transcript_74839:94-1086(-)